MRWPAGWIERRTGGREARLAAAVLALYRRLDRSTAAFRRRSGLSCLAGCGECCRSVEVEATILEMLPLALELLRRGRAEEILKRLSECSAPERCILFSERPLGPFGGRCPEYALRPLVCRLFGFAAVQDGEGRPRWTACRPIRRFHPERTMEIEAEVARGLLKLPSMRDYALAAYRLEPVLGGRPLPINQALAQALERVLLAERFRRSARRRAERSRSAPPAAGPIEALRAR